MKTCIISFCCFFYCLRASSQNEFAATAFYRDLHKIMDDAMLGFLQNKGKPVTSEFEGLTEEFRVKWMLPLADSGKIVFPKTSYPYVLYYFEPAKQRLVTDQKGANLRDAIALATNKPLYTRSETILIDNVPVTNTWIFDKENESLKSQALYLLSIYKMDSKYYLSLQINGRRPSAIVGQ
jgi:hypothetical protein